MNENVDRSRLEDERDERTGRSAAAERVRNQTRWVDLQVQEAMRRGEFDDLPGAGSRSTCPTSTTPTGGEQLIEREQIAGIAPAAIGLRKDDAELDAALDREASADGVRGGHGLQRAVVEAPSAHRRASGDHATRDVEAEVTAWQERRTARREAARAAAAEAQTDSPRSARRRWSRWPRR